MKLLRFVSINQIW